MQRIVVVGTSGSGKSTLARTLAQKLNLQYIEMDAVHWMAGWQSRPDADIRARLLELTGQPRWVIDGNYLKYSDISWARADTIIWLDYPMSMTFVRVTKRTFARWWRNELLWGCNRETLYGQFLSKDSLFLWVINTWRKNRRDLPKRLQQARLAGKQTYRLRSQRETDELLNSVSPNP